MNTKIAHGKAIIRQGHQQIRFIFPLRAMWQVNYPCAMI